MFLDPPYDTTFSEYDKNEFGLDDQRRLANYLINECPCRFLLIIKKTDFINSLYEGRGLHITESKKTYFVNFMGRTPQNEKEVVHLIITNYRRD
jgi:DNA adenine methylase